MTHRPLAIALSALFAALVVATSAFAGPQQPTWTWLDLAPDLEPSPGQSPAVVVAAAPDDSKGDAEAIATSLETGVAISLATALNDVDDSAALEARVVETGKTSQLYVGWFTTSLGRFDVVCRPLDEHVACRAYGDDVTLAMPLSAISWE